MTTADDGTYRMGLRFRWLPKSKGWRKHIRTMKAKARLAK